MPYHYSSVSARRFWYAFLVGSEQVLGVVCCMAVDNGCRDHLLHVLQCITYVVWELKHMLPLYMCSCEHFVKVHVDHATVVTKYTHGASTALFAAASCASSEAILTTSLVQWCLDTP